jgi:WD40 repeat protein
MIYGEQPKLWDLYSGRLSRSLGPHMDFTQGEQLLLLEPNGRRVLLRGKGAVELREVATGKLLHEFPAETLPLEFSTDSSQLLLVTLDTGAGFSHRFFDFDLATGTRRWESFLGRAWRSSMAGCGFLPGRGGWFVSLTDGTVSVRDEEDGRELRRLKLDVPVPYRSGAPTPDGQALVTGHNDGIIRLWDLADGRELARAKMPPARPPARYRAVPAGIPAFSPDGRSVAFGSSGMVALWTLPKTAAPGGVTTRKH